MYAIVVHLVSLYISPSLPDNVNALPSSSPCLCIRQPSVFVDSGCLFSLLTYWSPSGGSEKEHVFDLQMDFLLVVCLLRLWLVSFPSGFAVSSSLWSLPLFLSAVPYILLRPASLLHMQPIHASLRGPDRKASHHSSHETGIFVVCRDVWSIDIEICTFANYDVHRSYAVVNYRPFIVTSCNECITVPMGGPACRKQDTKRHLSNLLK